jgi:hypothetical protein
LKIVRQKESVKKRPTPRETVQTKIALGTAITNSASTARSGSAIVAKVPITKPAAKINHNFLEEERKEPICSPIGIMEASAPRVKKPIPRIKTKAPAKKSKRILKGMGTKKCNIRTIKVIGRTANKDSLILIIKFCIFIQF